MSEHSKFLGIVTGDVLAERVYDVHSKTIDAHVEPKPQCRRHCVTHRWVRPIEVGLARQKHVQVMLRRQLIKGPHRFVTPRANPIIGKRSVGLGVAPDVPVTMAARGRRSCVEKPRVIT